METWTPKCTYNDDNAEQLITKRMLFVHNIHIHIFWKIDFFHNIFFFHKQKLHRKLTDRRSSTDTFHNAMQMFIVKRTHREWMRHEFWLLNVHEIFFRVVAFKPKITKAFYRQNNHPQKHRFQLQHFVFCVHQTEKDEPDLHIGPLNCCSMITLR